MPTRFTRVRQVEIAGGDPQPTWLLPDTKPKFAEWSFGGGRPFNCPANSCKRFHCGVDLINAKQGAIVVTPEDCEIIAIDRNWSNAAKAVFARTTTGLFLVFGGTIRGSGEEWGLRTGQLIAKGAPIGRVLGSYGMIHFETYVDDGRTKNTPWYVGEEPPVGLLNPTNYVQRAAGQPETIESWTQIRAALAAMGFNPAKSGVWEALDTAALVEAQKKLGLESDGIWGPATEAAIRAELIRLGYPPAQKTKKGPQGPVVEPDTSSSWTSSNLAKGIGIAFAAGLVGGLIFYRPKAKGA